MTDQSVEVARSAGFEPTDTLRDSPQPPPASAEAKNGQPDSPANRDGCGCPSWVRCVHCDGTVVLLMDLEASDHRCLDGLAGNRYGVLHIRGLAWRPCVYGGCDVIGFFGPPTETTRDFPDLESAQADFDRRAAELIG